MFLTACLSLPCDTIIAHHAPAVNSFLKVFLLTIFV
uniref:Uncharacterized protein n=1 Tax=Siphoviridae sp. ctxMM9 TaxID=2827973 RepID=A0A8S5T633_9CAUD|nr:MAG TPA: hypothetical protein [Siphoviridae sp. ctxMM9]